VSVALVNEENALVTLQIIFVHTLGLDKLATLVGSHVDADPRLRIEIKQVEIVEHYLCLCVESSMHHH
jgi:hypothetical protein